MKRQTLSKLAAILGILVLTLSPLAQKITFAVATPALVTGQKATGSTFGTSMSAQFPSANTAGNLLIATVVMQGPSSTTSSYSDSLGNSAQVALDSYDPSGSIHETIYFVPNAQAGTNRITITVASAGASNLYISEWSGVDTAAPLDKTSFKAGYAGATPSANAMTTTADGDLIYGVMHIANLAGNAGTGFSLVTGTTGGDTDEYQVQPTAGAITTAFSNTSAGNGTWTITAVAFKAAGGTGGGTIDTTPPIISAISAGSITSSGATITWTTDENSNAQVEYGLTASYGSATTLNSTLSTSHTAGLSGLAAATTYHYRVKSADASGNQAASADQTFTTAAATVPDTTPPSVPTGLTATAISASQINLSWTASTDNVGVTGYKIYRGGTQIGTSAGTSYSDSGLTASTAYSYTVAAYDAAANVSAQSGSASATTQAGSSSGGGVGWTDLTNTKLQSVCSGAYGSCNSLVNAWSGGIADTTRNRLIVWGGGHADYLGNELYSLNLNANPVTMTRLNNPSAQVSDVSVCTPTLPDGNPNSRHTYNQLTYIPSADKMFAYNGAVACTGSPSHFSDTWLLNLSNLAWTRMDPVNGNPLPSDNYPFGLSIYDPNSDTVFVSNMTQLFKYNRTTNTYTRVSNSFSPPGGTTPVIDTTRKVMYLIGTDNTGPSPYLTTSNPKIESIDISNTSSYTLQDITSQVTGSCTPLFGASYPGVAYDSALDKIVGWPNFGNTVYIFDPATKSCTSQTFAGGPPDSVDWQGAKYTTGSYGRFQYFPSLDAFALVNSALSDAYLLRLTAGGGGGSSDTTPPTTPGTPVASVISTTQINLSWTASTDNVGVTGYKIYRGGTQIATSTGTSYSDSGLAASTAYSYTVSAYDAAGNNSAQSSAASATTQSGVVVTPSASDTLTITNTGAAATNYPLQIGRPFVQGEIASGQMPQAIVNGSAVPTQVDVKERWSDGSLKHAVISFLIPSIGAGQTLPVAFGVGTTVGNTPLSQVQMLDPAYNFEATMALTQGGVTKTASARTMLSNGDYTVWASGPIATTIVLANHQQTVTCGGNKASKYDFGFDSFCPFRPIYEATFWPTTHQVEVRFIGEVGDTEQLEDVPVTNLTLATGNTSPATVYTKANFTMYAASRWTKSYWLGGTPPYMGINNNLAYLIATKFIPNYDTTKVIPANSLTSDYSSWTAAAKDLYHAGEWQKYMPNTGGRPDIGPYPDWVVAYLYSGDSRLQQQAFGEADLAAAWPMNLREGNTSKFIDRAKTISGVGRPMSISTRPSYCLVCGSTYYNYQYIAAADRINPVGTIAANSWIPDMAHEPDPFSPLYAVSGDPFYLEQMQFWSSWNAATGDGSRTTVYQGRGPTGAEGGWSGTNSLQIRGQAWGLRSRAQTAFMSPDGTPEKAYFDTLTNDVLAQWEGMRNITGTQYQGNANWNWGLMVGLNNGASNNLWGGLGLPPLHAWEPGASNFLDPPVDPTKTADALSTWEQNFLIYALGRAKELGYASDGLLTWLGANLIGQVTDPGYNPYLSGSYRMPTILANGQYPTTWAQEKTGFTAAYQDTQTFDDKSPTGLSGSHILNIVGDGYPYFASGAMSYLTNLPGGAAGWAWMAANVENYGLLATNPKWAIIPRTGSSGGGGSTVPVISLFSASPPSITVGGSATLSWSVSGATSVSIDNGVGSVSGTSIVVTPGANTTYTLTATNAQGNSTAQTTVTVNLAPDTTNPTASITSPSAGTVSGSITFSATASDPSIADQVQSGLKSVTLLVDGSVFATSTASPITKTLDTTTLSNTAHSLTAMAQDNAGNTFTTGAISITVNNISAQKYPRPISLTALEALSVIPSAQQVTASVVSPANGSVLETQSNLNPSAGRYTVSFLSSDPQLVNIRIKAVGYLSQLLSNVDTTVNTATALTVPQLLAGDLNNDNTVNSLDYSALNANWLKSGTGDINQDGLVNSLDFAVLKNNFGKAGQ